VFQACQQLRHHRVDWVYERNQLQPRPAFQFRELFSGVEHSPDQAETAAQCKQQYEALMAQAMNLRQDYRESEGPRLLLHGQQGETLELTNVARSKHPEALAPRSQMEVAVQANQERGTPNRYAVWAPDGAGNIYKLGDVSLKSQTEHADWLSQHPTFEARPQVTAGVTEAQVDAAFDRAKQYAQEAAASLPAEDRQAVAAALWEQSTPQGKSGDALNRASAAFAMFADPIRDRCRELQFDSVRVRLAQEPPQEAASIEVRSDPEVPERRRLQLADTGEVLGQTVRDTPKPPVGARGTAEIEQIPGAGVTATSDRGNQIRITELKNHDFPTRDFQGERHKLTIDFEQQGRRQVPVAKTEEGVLGKIDRRRQGEQPSSEQKLRQAGLLERGQQLEFTLHRDRATVAEVRFDPQSMQYPDAKAVRQQEQARLAEQRQAMQQWYEDARVLGRSDSYLARMQQVEANLPQQGMSEPAQAAMQRDREAVQQLRTQECVPAIDSYLQATGSWEQQGQYYTLRREGSEGQTVSVIENGSGNVRMRAEHDGQQWQSHPVDRGLSKQDVARFQQLPQRQQQQVGARSQGVAVEAER